MDGDDDGGDVMMNDDENGNLLHQRDEEDCFQYYEARDQNRPNFLTRQWSSRRGRVRNCKSFQLQKYIIRI